MHPWYDVMKWHHLCDLPPQNPQSQASYEENFRKIPTKGHPTIYLVRTPKHYQGHQKQSLRCQNQEEPKKHDKCSLVTWMGS